MAHYSLRPLATNEQAANAGFTHIATISSNDLTETTNNTAQTLTLASLMAGDVILKVLWRIKTYFQDASDAAFNTSTMSIGNTVTGVAAHIAAIETNVNGTEVRQGLSTTAVMYTAADSITATFNAMSGKNLNNIDTGEVEVLVQLLRPAQLEAAVTSTDSTK